MISRLRRLQHDALACFHASRWLTRLLTILLLLVGPLLIPYAFDLQARGLAAGSYLGLLFGIGVFFFFIAAPLALSMGKHENPTAYQERLELLEAAAKAKEERDLLRAALPESRTSVRRSRI